MIVDISPGIRLGALDQVLSHQSRHASLSGNGVCRLQNGLLLVAPRPVLESGNELERGGEFFNLHSALPPLCPCCDGQREGDPPLYMSLSCSV